MNTKKKSLLFLFLGLTLLFGYMPSAIAQKVQVYSVAEQMPQYSGGEKAMQEFIRANVKYPVDAIKNNIQGRVIVRFIVDETGKIKDAEIVRGIHSSCDAEALRIIKSMPDWIPGKQDGRNIPVYFNLPIQFKMTKNASKSRKI